MKKVILIILAFATFGLVNGAILTNNVAYATGVCPSNAPNAANAKTPAECFLDPPAGTEKNMMNTVKNLIDTAIGVVGVAAVIVMIIGGVYFVISQGDAAKITRARNTILYGLVGLVVAILAFAIVNFVLSGMFNSGTTTTTTTQQEKDTEDTTDADKDEKETE